MRFVFAPLLALLVGASGAPIVAAQTFGFTTEPLVPVGKFAKAIDIGWGATAYVGFRLGGRKSRWALEADVAAQWLAGDSIDPDSFPDIFPPDSTDGDGIQVSGFLFPIRASITRLFGRSYFSPRVGVFIPAGDLKSKLKMEPSFGISPKIGYFFFITRELTADIGFEYTVVFDRDPLMYFGLSFGFLMGGERLPRKRTPY